jgi:allantoicase
VPGRIEEIEVDTSHFKGNFPESCSLEACYFDPQEADAPSETASAWKPLLPRTKLEAHHRHIFRGEVQEAGLATHVRLNIYPDGGIARLRLYGHTEASPNATSGIARFNELKTSEARKVLLDCCGSRRWVSRMLAQKPYSSVDRLIDSAAVVWNGLEPADWLEAFLHHPAIGEKKAEAKQSENAKQWSSGEQSIAQMASPETLARLAEANREYREKFGYVFLICATGKAADEILEGLERRLPNDGQTELQIAAEEQLKITKLRLKKFLES